METCRQEMSYMSINVYFHAQEDNSIFMLIYIFYIFRQRAAVCSPKYWCSHDIQELTSVSPKYCGTTWWNILFLNFVTLCANVLSSAWYYANMTRSAGRRESNDVSAFFVRQIGDMVVAVGIPDIWWVRVSPLICSDWGILPPTAAWSGGPNFCENIIYE